VKVVTSTEMAWGYAKQTIDVTGKDGKHAGYLVWSGLRPSERRIYMEGGFAGLEYKAASSGLLTASQRRPPSSDFAGRIGII
jgi:hypothetical protein